MTITTEEAEAFARQLDANEPGVSDPVAIEFFGDVATALRALAAERDRAEAEAERLRDAVTAVIIAYEHDIAQGVEPSEDRRRVIAVLRAALEGGDKPANEKTPDR